MSESQNILQRAAALAPGPERSAAWERVNRLATLSSAWVPWLWTRVGVLHGPGVRDPVYSAMLTNVDWVNVGLRNRP